MGNLFRLFVGGVIFERTGRGVTYRLNKYYNKFFRHDYFQTQIIRLVSYRTFRTT